MPRLAGCIGSDAESTGANVGSGGWADALPEFREARGVEIVGVVDDLAEEYRRAAICVAPIYDGGGTKIKVLEALAFNRAVVCTPHAAYGLHPALTSQSLFCVDDDESMSKACVRLMGDNVERNRRAAAGKKIIDARYHRAAFTEAVLDACDAALGADRRAAANA